MNALRVQRTRLATSVVNQATSPETAKTPLLRELVVEAAVGSLPVVGLKSAIRYAKFPQHLHIF